MKNALEEIRQSIPPYAPWQLERLEIAFQNYRRVLTAIIAAIGTDTNLQTLQENTARIRSLIDDAKASGSSLAYDRAAMELTWDVEFLIRMLGRTT